MKFVFLLHADFLPMAFLLWCAQLRIIKSELHFFLLCKSTEAILAPEELTELGQNGFQNTLYNK